MQPLRREQLLPKKPSLIGFVNYVHAESQWVFLALFFFAFLIASCLGLSEVIGRVRYLWVNGRRYSSLGNGGSRTTELFRHCTYEKLVALGCVLF